MDARPWTITPDGLSIAVRLTPKSSRDAVESIEVLADGRAVLKARVRAVPEDGKANDALLTLVARALGVARRQATLAGGATSRLKTVRVGGDGPSLATTLDALCRPAPKG